MIIVHIGMHKTGSTSIQRTFFRLKDDRVYGPPWPESNHSHLFNALFHPSPEMLERFRLSGRSPARIREVIDTLHGEMRQVLQRRRSERTPRPLVISGEAISSAPEEAVRNMAEFLGKYSAEDVRIVAYVRPPRSFISSAFQQRVKYKGRATLANMKYWPHYRRWFEKFDRIFGRESVTLKPFQRERLEGGDVVLDFACEIGIALNPGEVVRVNTSISLEAVALLHVRQRFGRQLVIGDEHDAIWHREYAQQISKLGSRRFVLSDNITDPLVEANRADLEWMEARLGAPLSEPAVPEGQGIGSEEELIAAALAARPLVEDMIAQKIADLPAMSSGYASPDAAWPDSDTPVRALACRIDLLKDLLKPPKEKKKKRKRKKNRKAG